MAKDRPWFMLYAETWLADPHLRLCDASDRGTLIDLMCLAHHGDPYGYVTNGEKPLTDKEIPKALGIPWQTWRKNKEALLAHARIGFNEESEAYFIPRMVRDGIKSDKARINGLQGGNPNLVSPGEDLLFEFIEQIWKNVKKKKKGDDGGKIQRRVDLLFKQAEEKLTAKQFNEMKELIDEWSKKGRPGDG